jgi:acetyl-CoA carboxylase carboxyltransferase component
MASPRDNADPMEARYPVLPTRIDPRDAVFRANYEANLDALAAVSAALAQARMGGGPKYNARHRAAGKLLPRERIELLVDPDSHFLELCALAGHDVGSEPTGAAVVGGVGVVSGVECLITASEATVKGGAISELGVAKTRRLAEIAEQNRLPIINLIESAGADLPNQSKIFVPGGRGLSRAHAAQQAACAQHRCLVFGSSTAGGAYIPGMSDYTVMVKNAGAGVPGRAAAGEDGHRRGHRPRGAGRRRRCTAASRACRTTSPRTSATRCGWGARSWRTSAGASRAPAKPRLVEPPRYDPDELLGIASPDLHVPFDAREVIARIVDGSRFSEFKPLYGSTLVCGWAHLHGYRWVCWPTTASSSRSRPTRARSSSSCATRAVPLVFLQNITGFMVGRSTSRRASSSTAPS